MMERLSENQEKMQDLTNAAIEEFSDKNEKLIEQQNQMLKVSDAHRYTSTNKIYKTNIFFFDDNKIAISFLGQQWKVIYMN